MHTAYEPKLDGAGMSNIAHDILDDGHEQFVWEVEHRHVGGAGLVSAAFEVGGSSIWVECVWCGGLGDKSIQKVRR